MGPLGSSDGTDIFYVALIYSQRHLGLLPVWGRQNREVIVSSLALPHPCSVACPQLCRINVWEVGQLMISSLFSSHERFLEEKAVLSRSWLQRVKNCKNYQDQVSRREASLTQRWC